MARFVAVGAGRMGRGIAISFAYAGHSVDLVDLRTREPEDLERLKRAVEEEIQAGLNGLATLGAMPADLVPIIARRVRFVDRHAAPDAIAGAEMLFEGVPETLEAKREAFEIISRHASSQAIITSTTSSILVTQLCGMVREPQRFLNMHWLNPAYIIPVVELSQHPGTAPAVLERVKALMESIGKVPVVCGPTPGYIVPRLQALMMNEAARMVEEGAATAEDIDKATRYGLGLRFAAIGVVEFIDFGGCDILHHASREMSKTVDAARYAAPPIVQRMVEQGRLGLKTGSGFHDYGHVDLGAYRLSVLGRVMGLLRHVGLWRPPQESDQGQP